ncbi:hypothetical protein LTR84_002855 [Exophiala bonariae]|uniref:NmrA-like domain-containing protein n=1 Tax=Exophiala bonariae TaxID=1690606 RepID=A0AAV9N9W2_9EURO|nr:hypothetical protein LTR84_002855 [Exophiala bonariae]
MENNHISRVAIVGATGSLGSSVLTALLAQSEPLFSVTVITRPGSITPSSHKSLVNHPRITIKEGSYSDPEFLASVLEGQDAVVLTLSFNVSHELQPDIIRAACKAKVSYIIPNEFGSDTGNPALIEAIPMHQAKVDARKLVGELGVDEHGNRTSSWIGIINNPWYDWSLPDGYLGIHPKTREVTFFDKGDLRVYMSTIELSGKATARVLSLPLHADAGTQRTLPSYANKFVYVRGFEVSQRDILESVQRATNTTDKDWKFHSSSAKEHIDDGHKMLAQGNMAGIMNLIFGNTFIPGIGADYRGAPLDNVALGLDGVEGLDKVTATTLQVALGAGLDALGLAHEQTLGERAMKLRYSITL